MKTQIIQLETYDDNVSVRDKMGWGQTNRILLVWPSQGVLLDRRLDLILLHRHCQRLGAQLGLVTRDPQVKAHASDLGIPVFENARKANTGRWRMSRRRRNHFRLHTAAAEFAPKRNRLLENPPKPRLQFNSPSVSSPLTRWLVFGLTLCALLALSFTFLPSARVNITPAIQTQQITLPVTANTSVTGVTLSGDLPAQWTSTEIEGRSSIPVSGQVSVPEKSAQGEVIFANLTNSIQEIPAETVVTTLKNDTLDNVWRYKTLEKVKIAAGVNQSVKVRVQAVMPGKDSNQPAGAIQAIEGPLGLSLSVTNRLPIQGGTSRNVPGPSKDDRENIYNLLLASLQTSAMEELESAWQANPFEHILPITPTIQVSEILTRTYQPSTDLPAGQIELTLRVEFRILGVNGTDLAQLVRPVMDTNLQPGQHPLPSDIKIVLLQPFRLSGEGQAIGILFLQRDVIYNVSQSQAAELIKGARPAQASTLLQNTFKLGGPAEILIWPDWWPYLPLLPMRIQINGAESF